MDVSDPCLIRKKKQNEKYLFISEKFDFQNLKISTFSEKKIIIRLIDHKILTEGLALLDAPRRCSFMTHRDRYYLYSRLKFINGVLDEVKEWRKNKEKLQQTHKRRANIKLVWVNKS